MAPLDLSLLALTSLTAIAALIDFRTGLIPNRLVVAGFVIGVALQVAGACSARATEGELVPPFARAALSVVLGVVVCGLGPFVLFRLGAMGGGDVKLLGAAGASVGPALGIQIELWAFIIAAAYAPLRLSLEGQLPRLLANVAALLTNPLRPPARRRPLPELALTGMRFGPAIFFATLLVAASSRLP